MMKRKILALLAVATYIVGTFFVSADASAQEWVPPPTTAAPPANTGVLATLITRPTPDPASTDGHFWFQSDFLFAFVRATQVPALVTTSSAGTSSKVAGTLGNPSTSILFGNQWLNGDLRPGLHLATGYWFDSDRNLGIEANFNVIGGQASEFSGNSNQFPILARPYTDAVNGSQQAVLVAFPGQSTGSIDARVLSSNFYDGSFDITEKVFDLGWFRLIGLVGYRAYNYDESLRVNQTLTSINPKIGVGIQDVANDSFAASNTFNGIDMGFRAQFVWDQLALELLAKCAVGDVQRRIAINGNQTITVPGIAPLVEQGGVLALASNSGYFASHDWKAMPEFGVNFSYQIRPYVTLRAGYSFILLSGIARAADQIDTTINQNLLPPANFAAGGPLRPAFGIQRTDMWIQTLHVGLEFTY